MNSKTCSFCNRQDAPGIGYHHIVPRCKDGKQTVLTCACCERFIHATWSNNELRDNYNTVEAIKQDKRFQKYLNWLSKQKPGVIFSSIRCRDRAKGRYK